MKLGPHIYPFLNAFTLHTLGEPFQFIWFLMGLTYHFVQLNAGSKRGRSTELCRTALSLVRLIQGCHARIAVSPIAHTRFFYMKIIILPEPQFS